jgi:hypothetical protein
MKSSRLTNLIVCTFGLCSIAILISGLQRFRIPDVPSFSLLLVLALAASRLKISMPRMESSMSVNLPFILIALAKLSLGEAILIAALSGLVQCLPVRGSGMRPIQIVFNTCTLMNAAALSGLAFHQAGNLPKATGALLITAAAATFLLADTVPVALIIAATEAADIGRVWRKIFTLTFPYFVLSAGIAAIVLAASFYIGWYALGVLPVMYGVHCSYRAYWEGSASGEKDLRAYTAASSS